MAETQLKIAALTGYPWRSLWYLDLQLKRKRHFDPALSWTNRCEAPSMWLVSLLGKADQWFSALHWWDDSELNRNETRVAPDLKIFSLTPKHLIWLDFGFHITFLQDFCRYCLWQQVLERHWLNEFRVSGSSKEPRLWSNGLGWPLTARMIPSLETVSGQGWPFDKPALRIHARFEANSTVYRTISEVEYVTEFWLENCPDSDVGTN